MLRRALPLVLIVVAAVCVIGVGLRADQSERRATVATTKGDVVSGTLKSVSETEIVMEVAGQPFRLATADARYISFIGEIAASPAPPAPTPKTPMEVAFESLDSLKAATSVGVLREQYSQKLVETLPPVMTFVKETEGWDNVRGALLIAATYYQRPMESVQQWSNGSIWITRAATWADYAKALSSRPGEESHVETDTVVPLTAPATTRGRLASGDAFMPGRLDRSSEGALNDRYTIRLPTYSTLTIEMTCLPCDPHLTLANTQGQVDGDAGKNGTSTITKRNLPAGEYTIWAGTYPGQVGDYALTVTVTQASGR